MPYTQTSNTSLSKEFLQFTYNEVLRNRPIYLGIIEVANAVSATQHLSNLAPIYAAEYAPVGYVRPVLTLTDAGFYDQPSDSWISNLAGWVINPSATINVSQFFMIIDGTATPRNQTGIFYGLNTTQDVTFPGSIETPVLFPIRVNRNLFGAPG